MRQPPEVAGVLLTEVAFEAIGGPYGLDLVGVELAAKGQQDAGRRISRHPARDEEVERDRDEERRDVKRQSSCQKCQDRAPEAGEAAAGRSQPPPREDTSPTKTNTRAPRHARGCRRGCSAGPRGCSDPASR